MDQELELSIMDASSVHIQPLLDQFAAKEHIQVRVRLLSWDSAWSDLMRMALYGDGADVSEIGSTWVGDLVAMQALRPFADDDLALLGGTGAFLPTAWKGAHLIGQAQAWAIPWLTGARLLFFRRHLLERAGVDESTAFATAAQLDRTLGRLQAAGVAVPWTVPIGSTHTTLLNVASWVWGAGGDFVTPEGDRTLFSQPQALAGLAAYFGLARYLAPAVRRMTGDAPDQQFLHDPQTAVTVSGPWLFGAVREQGAAELPPQLGVSLPPGPSFVGGSYLAIWKYSPRYEAALKLIRFLTQAPQQVRYAERVGLLPVTHEAVAAPPFATDPLWQLTIRGVETGRSFPVTRSWGMLEYRLVATLRTIWTETLANPQRDLEAALKKQLDPLAERLDQLLGQA